MTTKKGAVIEKYQIIYNLIIRIGEKETHLLIAFRADYNMAFESRARNGNRDDVSRLKPRNDASKDSRKEVNLVPEDGYDGAHEVDWLKKHHMRKRKESNKNKRLHFSFL